MISTQPSPLEIALMVITFAALIIAVLCCLGAAAQMLNVRDPEEATAIARRIGKPEVEVAAAADAATRRSVRLRHFVLLAAAFGAIAGLTDFILPPMLGLA